MHAEVIVDTYIANTELIEPIDRPRIVATAAGAVLLMAGVDFSDLTPLQHDTLSVKKITGMAVNENYRRWLLVKQHVLEGFEDMRADWQAVKQAKNSRLWGPLGSIAHYLTHLNYENEQEKAE